QTTDRRRVFPGPLNDFLAREAATAYDRLLRQLPKTPALLALVPSLLGKGELDAAILHEIIRMLPDTPLLPVLSGEGGAVAPEPVPGREAKAVPGPAAPLEKIARTIGRAAGRAGAGV